MEQRKILFLTGTRADYGKMKALMLATDNHERFECQVFITGMHTLQRYGYTAKEVVSAGYTSVYTFMNQHVGDRMEMILASTIKGLSRYIHENKPDMLVIHGDRVEALAGAIVGALTNTLVCHIEGGERSGTIDESIRHSVSKLSHLHMVSNNEAVKRLVQMGERQEYIHNIGSPDIDVMLSSDLPDLDTVKEHYAIPFENYSVVLFHPVTTDIDNMPANAKAMVDALLKCQKNFVVVYPNNDEGSDYILKEYDRLKDRENFRIYPSIRFESFLTLLKNSECMIGNSSAGIRETPFYGMPSINIGDRQNARYFAKGIINTGYDSEDIYNAIQRASHNKNTGRDSYFGDGNSTEKFMSIIQKEEIWSAADQKLFNDVDFSLMAPAIKGVA
ncbi:UDP-N-acetylglucosamine 2-epimerase [Endozoicomonas sp. SESOKO2]|uniref:UDP-N-acetylglucosamine 2-epimerase n=1 Tax=Endozoicomonas sp. SESOKO2 TaxID=2828743 RepID=UPI0021475CFE|nr:UDP-N-acetylglucosamine 2-epimerase [Endozoicomonas sp. SESOKO2]